MARIDNMEQQIHGKTRASTSTTTSSKVEQLETRFGVLHKDYPIMLAKGNQQQAQWTGVVTGIAISMLENDMVDAVVCIASDGNGNDNENDNENENGNGNNQLQLQPRPILAKTVQEVLRGRGVKPSLAPSLRVLDEIKQDPSIKRLLFCGVGCAVQAFRAKDVQDTLGLDKVYVLGTNCADNSPSVAASMDFIQSGLRVDVNGKANANGNANGNANVKGYEFMQDFQVHVKKSNGSYEKIPYFSLPGQIARSSIADSCLACFDYTNALADVVVGYMGAPLDADGTMDSSLQTLTIRNDLGKEMVDAAIQSGRLSLHGEALGTGSWQDFAVQTVASDGIVTEILGGQAKEEGMPRFLGNIMAKIVTAIGPKGINFASYSIDYHLLRNYLHVIDVWGEERAESSMPQYAKDIVREYLANNKTFRKLKESILASKQ